MTEPNSKELEATSAAVGPTLLVVDSPPSSIDQKSVITRQVLKKQVTYTPGDSASCSATGQGSLNYFLNRNVSFDVKETAEHIIDPLKIFEFNHHDNTLAQNHNSSFNLNNNENNNNSIEQFSLHRTNECEHLNYDDIEYNNLGTNLIAFKSKENSLKPASGLENLSEIS